jgi:hypothetical protein
MPRRRARRSRLCLLGKRFVPNGGGLHWFPGCEGPQPSRSGTAKKDDSLRFCGLVFALEVIQSTTTLDKLVVLFPHLTLFTGEKVAGQ